MKPDGAHVMYPFNDHPRDKATFTFPLDVPAGATAVANGVLAGERPSGGWTTRTYRQNQPMATELTQIAVGDFVVTSPGEYPGVLVRDVTPRPLQDELTPKLDVVLEQLVSTEERLGRYPFDVYGSLVVDAALGFALETQTPSVTARSGSATFPRASGSP